MTTTTYYAVCNVNGPISVELSGDTKEEALASFAELDAREAIDDAMTDAEDALSLGDCSNMSDDEFTEALEGAGAELVCDLSDPPGLKDGWALWAAAD